MLQNADADADAKRRSIRIQHPSADCARRLAHSLVGESAGGEPRDDDRVLRVLGPRDGDAERTALLVQLHRVGDELHAVQLLCRGKTSKRETTSGVTSEAALLQLCDHKT